MFLPDFKYWQLLNCSFISWFPRVLLFIGRHLLDKFSDIVEEIAPRLVLMIRSEVWPIVRVKDVSVQSERHATALEEFTAKRIILLVLLMMLLMVLLLVWVLVLARRLVLLLMLLLRLLHWLCLRLRLLLLGSTKHAVHLRKRPAASKYLWEGIVTSKHAAEHISLILLPIWGASREHLLKSTASAERILLLSKREASAESEWVCLLSLLLLSVLLLIIFLL